MEWLQASTGDKGASQTVADMPQCAVSDRGLLPVNAFERVVCAWSPTADVTPCSRIFSRTRGFRWTNGRRMNNNVHAEPVEQNGSWVPSRLRNRLQESVTVCTGRVIPAGICSTGSVFASPHRL